MRKGQQPPQYDAFNRDDVVIYDIETIVLDGAEPADGSFPPWPRHHTVSAAFLRVRKGVEGYEFTFDVVMCRPGEEAAFYEKIDRLIPANATGVSFNGRGFDNRVLSIQSMRHVPAFNLRSLSRQVFAGRFDGAHCDLADQFGGLGGARPVSLAEICHALDIPIKTSTSGSEVGALWRAGKHAEIRDYVREDVLATYICWLHFIAFAKADESLLTLPLAGLAAWIETEPQLAHLRPFADCRPARVARLRAPALRATAALADAERRLARERDEEAFAAGTDNSF